MIVSLFRRSARNANDAIIENVYQAIIETARKPVLFANYGVPDTPLGRYESLSAHMIAFLHRTRSSGENLEALAQDIVDEFFTDVDHSIRELGIGDTGVPKRMKKLGKMFYGRMGPYWTAFDGGSIEEFEAALRRNIRPDDSENLRAEDLAAHMMQVRSIMGDYDNDDYLNGRVAAFVPKVAA
ncbi:MAG: ubiquinol-cytochrome C chaperone family protein [Pseudomonadota bacterium]